MGRQHIGRCTQSAQLIFKNIRTIALCAMLPILIASCGFANNSPQKRAIEAKTANINIRPSEDPTVNPEVTISEEKPNYASRDQQCLAEAMYFEAKGTGERGMRAVGEVVLNRANDSRFPSSVCGVVDQRYNGSCQFSYRCDGRPEIYNNKSQKALADRLAQTLLTNRGQDITNGALFFHSARIKAGWFGTLSRRGKFGGNIFYR